MDIDIIVKGMIYVAEGAKTRIVPVIIDGRKIELRVRPSSGNGPLERPRLVVVTSTLKDLPPNRKGRDLVESKRMAGNICALITVWGDGAFADLRRPAPIGNSTDVLLGPAIMEMLGKVFPGYRFV